MEIGTRSLVFIKARLSMLTSSSVAIENQSALAIRRSGGGPAGAPWRVVCVEPHKSQMTMTLSYFANIRS